MNDKNKVNALEYIIMTDNMNYKGHLVLLKFYIQSPILNDRDIHFQEFYTSFTFLFFFKHLKAHCLVECI
jgi:hypothetical protein